MDVSPRWRIWLGLLAVPQLITGTWAVVASRNWYEDFPGGGRHWVAVDGPFNHHLSVDAGSGFLATGVLLVIAAAWLERRVVQAALVTLLAFAVPHFVYHVTHIKDAMSDADNALSLGGQAFGVILALVLLVRSTARPRARQEV